MATAEWPLQEAIYARLTGDAALMGLVSGVFDEVPEATPYPYVVLGETTENRDEAHDRSGVDAAVVLHIWSRYRGYAEAAGILREIDRLLHHADLAVDGFQKVSIFSEQHQFIRDPNPDLRRAIVRYRCWLEEPPQ